MLRIKDILLKNSAKKSTKPIVLGMTVSEVEKIMGSSPRKIEQIKINIFFIKDFDKKIRRKLENAALTCPVSNSLNASLKKSINFIYP